MTSYYVSKKKLAPQIISERGWDLENHADYRMDIDNTHKRGRQQETNNPKTKKKNKQTTIFTLK